MQFLFIKRSKIFSNIRTQFLVETCFITNVVSLSILAGRIYAIGGSDGTLSLSDCEEYDVATNAWTSLSLLNVSRYSLGSTVFNGQKIFAIFGYNCPEVNDYLSSIEKYEFKDNKWKMMEIDGKLDSIYELQCMQLSPNEILVFGGCKSGTTCDKTTVLKANNDRIQFQEGSKLKDVGAFYWTSAPIRTIDKIYAIDNGRNMHIFSLTSRSWERKAFNTWML